MAADKVNLPKGFVLDEPVQPAGLPPGFELDTPEEGPNPVTNTLSFVNKAIAQTLGAPIDVSRGILNMFPGLNIPKESIGGSESIKRGFEKLGIATARREPKTLPEYAGTGIGEVTSLLVPFGKAVETASKGTSLASRVSKNILETIQKHPYLTAVSEVTGGAGAGTGRFAKEEVLPEGSALGQFTEIAGGLAGGASPALLNYTPVRVGKKLTRTILRKVSSPFTEEGSKFRAGQFLKAQVKSPAESAERLAEETISELPPAVASGEKRLISLYNQFRVADPVTDAEEVARLGRSIVTLEGELRKMGYSAPEVLKNITGRRIAALELGMNKRVADAMTVADKKLNAIPKATRQSQESLIVRNELDKVFEKELARNKELWASVPKRKQVGYETSKETYDKLLKDLSQAQKEDVPEVLRKSFLAGDEAPDFPVNVKEMQGLRSKLLEVGRIAKKNGEWNKARIAGDMADAILDDMAAEGADGALKTAIAHTRQMKERFERGIVGRIMGYSKTGAPSMSPELTLDITVGRAGVRGSVDIKKIAPTPEAVEATKRYMGRSFTDYTTDKGTKPFNALKAEKWIENNREILDQFPDFRAQLNDVAKARQFAEETSNLMAARLKRIQDPRISTTARFLKSDPGKEIDSVFKSSDPANMTRQLVRQTRKDPTGEALQGLKGSYVNHMIKKAQIGPYNESGEQTLSGRSLLGFLNKNRGALREVFSKEEISRMETIGRELSKLETVERGTSPVKIQLDDAASNLLLLINRVGGAQAGRVIAGWTGGGTVQTPAIFSERFKNFTTHLTKDRAFQLVHDAVIADDGGKLLKALLLPINKPKTSWGLNNLRTVNNRMNLWLLGTGSRILDDIHEEDPEAETLYVSPKKETFMDKISRLETQKSQESSRHRAPQARRVSDFLRRPPQIVP